MKIHVDRGGQRFGPYEVEEVNAYLASGSLLDTDLGWIDGMPDWVPLTQLPGVTVTGIAPPHTGTSVEPSAGKRKLFIGIGATVGVCVIGVVVWLFFIKGDDVKPDDGKAGAGVSSGNKKSGLTLAEFIKDKRIYYGKRERKTGTVYNFRQYNADGTFQEGLEDGKGNTVLPPNPPGFVMRYEVEGLTIKLKASLRDKSLGDITVTCPKAELSGGDKLVEKHTQGSKEMTVIKVTSGPFKPSVNLPQDKRPQGYNSPEVKRALAAWKDLLSRLDKDNDGRLSRTETSQIPAWRDLFDKMNLQRNGTISEGEYLLYYLKVARGGGTKKSP